MCRPPCPAAVQGYHRALPDCHPDAIMRLLRSIALAAAAAAVALPACAAGAATPAGDALGACLVAKSTSRDRKDLARWMFVALAAHPEIQAMSKVSAADRENAIHAAADIFSRLLTVDCLDETRAAIRTGGPGALQASGNQLGQVAMQELMSDPNVSGSVAGIVRYIDPVRIATLMMTQ